MAMKAYTQMFISEYNEKKLHRDIKDSNPITLMTHISGSIASIIQTEYTIILFVHIIIDCIFGMKGFDQTSLYRWVKLMKEYLDNYPSEILIFPLIFTLSHTLTNAQKNYEENVARTTLFAFFVKIYFDPDDAKHLLDQIHKITALTFRNVDSTIVLEDMVHPNGEPLFSKEEIKKYDTQRARNLDNYGPQIGIEMVKYVRNITGITDEKTEKFIQELKVILEQCRRLEASCSNGVSFVYVTTVILLCNVYIIHLFFDFIDFKTSVPNMSYLIFTFKFLIFYGWAKLLCASVHPFNRHKDNQFDLQKIQYSNLYRGYELLNGVEKAKMTMMTTSSQV